MSKSRRNDPATMADLARLAGVHVSTVSRALAGSPLVAKDVRERILTLAREQRYVVNATARNLRLQRTQTISVAVPLGHEAGQTLTDPFFVEMLAFVADEITQRGHGMLLQKILPPMDGWLETLIGSRKSDGIICIGQSTEHKKLQAAAALYKPLVVWGGHMKRQSYCTVGTDNVAGARAVVEHLINTGRRRIVFLGDPTMPEIQLRYQGYREALNAAPRGPLPARSVAARLTLEAAYESMRAFIETGAEFDAIFGATDVIAVSALRALRAAVISVPKDVALVGFDDISLAAHCVPALTTVRQDLARGAKIMVDLLFRRMQGLEAPSATMPAEIIVRESSGGNC